MPLYEYQCIPNGHRFEVRHGISESPVESCSECGAPVRRVIHPVGIVFKGSGFYVNDSRKSNAASKPSDGAGESKPDAATKSSSPAQSDSTATPKAESGPVPSKEKSPAAD